MIAIKEHVSAGRLVLVALAVFVGVAAGAGALLGAAVLTSRPPLFLLAGLAGFCAVYLLGLLAATRKVDPDRRRHAPGVPFFVGTVLIVGPFVLTALLPMGDPRLPPAPVEGQRFWDLPTGSRIAYLRVPPGARPAGRPSYFCTAAPAPRT